MTKFYIRFKFFKFRILFCEFNFSEKGQKVKNTEFFKKFFFFVADIKNIYIKIKEQKSCPIIIFSFSDKSSIYLSKVCPTIPSYPK